MRRLAINSQPVQASPSGMQCTSQVIISSTPRAIVSSSATRFRPAWTAEGKSHSSVATPRPEAAASPLIDSNSTCTISITSELSARVPSVWPSRDGNAGSTAPTNADPLLPDVLLEHAHRAPAGIADRIAAATQRHASWQLQRQQQQQQLQQPHQHPLTAQRQDSHPPLASPSRPLSVLPRDSDSCLREIQVLSRACQSLAFHISSHFHVPTFTWDPLAGVLSSSTSSSITVAPLPSAPASTSSGAAHSLLAAPPTVSLPTPPPPHGAADTIDTDMYGVYDSLPAVYSFKAVAAAMKTSDHWCTAPPHQLHPHVSAKASQNPCSPGGTPSAPKNAVVHVVSTALLHLSYACGHIGCYRLAGPPPPEAILATGAGSLAGLPFTGRQLSRLCQMARADAALDLGGLSGFPANTAAALLLLLAAAQPPRHPSIVAAPMTGSAASAVINCTVPAALLARYLRVGSRSRNALDTVRVMWALMRLQLPSAGSLQLPLSHDAQSSSSSSSSSNNGKNGDGTAAAAVAMLSKSPQLLDAMSQLARILARQLRNRDRVRSALRAARPGELYGAWQLGVQVLILLRDREFVAERSVAALALLEAAPSDSGSRSASGSGSKYPGSESGLGGHGGREAAAQQRSGVLETLQTFLELTGEVYSAREAAAAAGGTGKALGGQAKAGWIGGGAGVFPGPAWRLLPTTETEWRTALRDTEQRAALLLSTWPELGRLVEPPPQQLQQQLQQQHRHPPQPPQQPKSQYTQLQQQLTQIPAHAAPSGDPHSDAPLPSAAGPNHPNGPVASAPAAVGGAGKESGEALGLQRRLRIHLQSYSVSHSRTLELLYRAVKAQAPDATLLAPLSAAEASASMATGSTGCTRNGAMSDTVGTFGASGDGGVVAAAASVAMSQSQRILKALALPYCAPVDMIFTDAHGRRLGLSLAHLGTSRRAPGEIAVLHHALTGWPEAHVPLSQQQGVRAGRNASKAVVHGDAPSAHTTTSAVMAAATACVMVGDVAVVASASRSDGCEEAADAPWRRNNTTTARGVEGVVQQAVGVKFAGYSQADRGAEEGHSASEEEGFDSEEGAWAEEVAAALEADAAAAAAGVAEEMVSQTTATAEAVAARETAAFSFQPSCSSGGMAGGGGCNASDPLVDSTYLDSYLRLDDVVVLELDHDWFFLRESYYDYVQKKNKWDVEVRQAISTAMSYNELPWEVQLDLVWHVLAMAGVELPIRVYT